MSLIQKLAEKALATLSQRGADNGYDKKTGTAQEERSAAQIARVFNELTGHWLTTTDAWTFLQVLKLVRIENQIKTGSGDLLDSCNDMIIYSMLKAETALTEYRPVQVDDMLSSTTGKTSADYPLNQVRQVVTGNHPSLHEVSNVAAVKHDLR